MTQINPAALAGRLQRLILTPRAEWPRIAAEPMASRDLWLRWAVPLAAIGPVAGLIAKEAWGVRALDTIYRPPLLNAVATALMSWAFALANVWVLAQVIDRAAPSFGAGRNPIGAVKAAVFASTAAWLAQIFWLTPPTAALSLVGFYSIYLLWLGLPLLMKPPAEKAPSYVAVSVACGVIAFLLLSVGLNAISDALTPPANAPGTVIAH